MSRAIVLAGVFAIVLAVVVPARADFSVVKEWTGTESKMLETFDVAGKEWRVNWSSTPMPDNFGSFGLLVYTADKKLVGSATGRVGAEGVTTVHEGPGRYYIRVTAARVEWKVTVEEDKDK